MSTNDSERYKIALSLFDTQSSAQQWLFNSHFVVHGIILSYLFSQLNISPCHANNNLITIVGGIGAFLGLLFLLGYYRASKIAGYRMTELKQLEENNKNITWEYFSGKTEDYINPGDSTKSKKKDEDVIPFVARFKNKWIRYIIINIIIALYTYTFSGLILVAFVTFCVISIIELCIGYYQKKKQKAKIELSL